MFSSPEPLEEKITSQKSTPSSPPKYFDTNNPSLTPKYVSIHYYFLSIHVFPWIPKKTRCFLTPKKNTQQTLLNLFFTSSPVFVPRPTCHSLGSHGIDQLAAMASWRSSWGIFCSLPQIGHLPPYTFLANPWNFPRDFFCQSIGWLLFVIKKSQLLYRDPGSPKLRMVMEPKYDAFWRWLDPPNIFSQYDWMRRDIIQSLSRTLKPVGCESSSYSKFLLPFQLSHLFVLDIKIWEKHASCLAVLFQKVYTIQMGNTQKSSHKQWMSKFTVGYPFKRD